MQSVITLFSAVFFLLQIVNAQKIDIYNRPVQEERTRDFDAIHYKVKLDVDIKNKMLTGVNEITLSPLNDHFDTVIFDAMYLNVTSVSGTDGRGLFFEQKNNQVFIRLNKSYDRLDTVQLTIKYSLDKQTEGLKFIDATGTNPVMVSSDCFPDKARQWIPCYDYPNDKVTTEMIVTVDKKYKVLSNGKLVGIKENDSPGKVTYHWSQDLPQSTYLINVSIAEYAVIKDSLLSLPINYWVYKGLEKNAKTTFRKTPSMIRFFNNLYKYPYPWAKYDQVITSYMGGGAEAVSATILGDRIVMDTIAEKDYSMENVIAHEIAHQWWGDLITLRSWEHTWLNESFATYSAYLFTRFENGENAGAFDLLGKKNQYLNEAHNRYMRPIVFNRYNDPNDNFDSHTYPKGACMLHLLRYLLGDEPFFKTLTTFLYQNEFKPVVTRDFMNTVNEISGKDMDWFFRQFIFSPGHPVFEISKSWNENNKKLTLTILQKQDTTHGVPIYRVPVNISFFLPGKKLVKEIWLKEKVENFEFEFTSEPQLVRFDEGNWLLKEVIYKKTQAELLFQAQNDDIIGRLEAVNELANYRSDSSTLMEWTNRSSNDNFWAVRQAAVEKIGKYYGDKSVAVLKICVKDENSQVRRSAIRMLGDLKDPKLIKLFEKVFKFENSYAVQAESLIAIGKCGNQEQIYFLKSAQKMKSYRDVINKAATEAIAEIMKK